MYNFCKIATCDATSICKYFKNCKKIPIERWRYNECFEDEFISVKWM